VSGALRTRLDVAPVGEQRALLGEGPAWDARRERLWWVDIERGLVLESDPSDGATRAVRLDDRVGAAVPAGDGTLIVALRDRVVRWDGERVQMLAEIEAGDERTRLNDGKADPSGRLWIGTMAFAERGRLASLYALERDGTLRRAVTGVDVSNGLGWSPDRATMYYVDSPTRRIDAFTVELDSGALRDRRTVVEIPAGEGLPDGMTVDADGDLWVALWGGDVRRYSAGGRLLQRLELPVSQPTSVCFGGAALDQLFITSASAGLDAEARAREPLAGALLVCSPGARGQPTDLYGG
jgi:sugar lactone lactonase YvrE